MGNLLEDNLKIILMVLVAGIITEMAGGLRIVQVIVPTAVESGNNVTLICEHDTEGDTLYSVKWYKGRREFFRYTPKEIPAEKLFPLPGIYVDQASTNSTQLVLRNVTPKVTGKYSCEVSADAPSFQTHILTGSMEVVVIPTGEPIITGIKPYYGIGEYLQGNCTLNGSMPSALLEWKINNFPAYPPDIIKYKSVIDTETKLESRTIGLSFHLNHIHFVKSKLKIQCTARIHDLYYGEAVKFIDEDRPQVYSPSLSYLSDEVNQRNAATKLSTMMTWMRKQQHQHHHHHQFPAFIYNYNFNICTVVGILLSIEMHNLVL